jgi:tetratricopeptide (TPR) repeat protein
MIIGSQMTVKRIAVYIVTGGFIILMIVLSQKQIAVWRNSETLWTNVIKYYPQQETARSIRGIYYAKMAKKSVDLKIKKSFEEKAMDDFKIAIDAGTKRADVLEGAGCIYGERGDFNNALKCLDQSVKLNPVKGSAYFNRGLTLSMLNRNEEAINDYNMSLIYSPRDAVKILTNRSNLFMLLGRFKEAIPDFDYLISLDSRNFVFFYNRGIAKQQINDIAGAISDYQKALQLEPGDQVTRQLLNKLKN